MVWQDFMFACSMYPATGEWLENVKMEARDNIRRLRNHPSIVIWCGGNERTGVSPGRKIPVRKHQNEEQCGPASLNGGNDNSCAR